MSTLKLITGLLMFVLFLNGKQINNNEKWEQIYSVIKNMEEPSFPSKEFDITDFGAVADGKTLNTKAINNTW